MSHKVHPKSFRISRSSDWDSRWFNAKNPSVYLEEDFKIRRFLNKQLKDGGVERIEIERSPNRTTILISTSRPGLIIGRGGEQVEELKKKIEAEIMRNPDKKHDLKIEIKSIKNPWLSAPLVAQWVAQRIERRMPFRRVLKQSISNAKGYKEIEGIRVQISGRLNGVSIARTEWLQEGKLPRGSLRADMDYGFCEAFCTYGVVGIKVWLYKGDKFE